MGTQAVNNLMNEIYYGMCENEKGFSKEGDFLKTLEDAANSEMLEDVSKKNVNPVDELKTEKRSDNVERNEETYDDSKVSQNSSVDNKKDDLKSGDSVKTDEKVSDDSKISDKKDFNLSEDDVEFVFETFGAFVDFYSETLQIPADEVIEYFETNDINIDDLLSSENVSEIVLGLSGIEDSSEILLNEQLYENIENIKDFAQNLLDEASDYLDSDSDEVISKVEELISQLEFDYEDVEEFDELDLQNRLFESEVNDIDAENGQINSVDNQKAMSVSQTRKDFDKDESSDNDTLNQRQNVVQNNFSQVNQADSEIGTEGEKLNETLDAQRIYDQIGEFVRSVSTEELKEVTLQLQPESLGTVQIRVSQREGALSAELITQNDNIKSVLEGQLIELQKEFEKSGVKVENIDVKVSTNGFEENAQSDSKNEENETARRDFPQRRININGLFDNEDVETLEDDEKIAVEMMTANGNSLDYQA